MMRIVFSEFLKYKRTFTAKLIWIAPLTVSIMIFFIGLGDFYQNGCYNIWYMFFLPTVIVLISSGILMKDEKRLHRRRILALPIAPEIIMLGKILIGVFFNFLACMIFPLMILVGGIKDYHFIPILLSFKASLLLYITTSWLVPFSFLLIDHIGTPLTIILQIGLYTGSSIFLSDTSNWWIPYAIPARFMCTVIKVLPNGLSVPSGDPLLDSNVIFPGISISIILFCFMTGITVLSYRNMEVN